MKKYIIHFEDHGQDFLQWRICGETGIIEDCQPFQDHVWVGKKVVANGNLVVGGKLTVEYVPSNLEIIYPIAEVEEIDEAICHYLSFIGQTYTLKNSLEKAFLEMIKNENRKLIPSHELGLFQNRIIEAVHALNKSFPRCKPINVSWYSNRAYSCDQAGKYADHFLSIGASICTFHLYASNEGEVKS
jgi:hypothetical protein